MLTDFPRSQYLQLGGTHTFYIKITMQLSIGILLLRTRTKFKFKLVCEGSMLCEGSMKLSIVFFKK
eukprot:SAG31_NODE_8453_length_1449_cov_1.189630_1_plen_66_part_00